MGRQDKLTKEPLPCQRKNNLWWNFEKKTTQKPVVSTRYKITFTPSDTAIYHDFLVENEENNFKGAGIISLFLPSLFSCSTLDN